MSDKAAESGLGQAEPVVPTTDASPDVPGAPTSQSFNEDALVAKVMQRLEPTLKKVQSEKDRRYSKLEGNVSEILAFRDKLKEAGIDPAKLDAATRDYQLDKLLAEPASPVSGGTATVTENPKAEMASWTKDILNEAEIDFEDPEYKALVKTGANGLADWQTKVTKFLARRAKQSVNPGAASAVASGTGASAAASGGKEAQLEQKYARLRALQTAPPTFESKQEMKKVSDEIVALGGYA